MFLAALVTLPVQAECLTVIDLNTVHADVACACAGFAGDDRGEGDVFATVVGPAFEDRQDIYVRIVGDDDFLTRRFFGFAGAKTNSP